MTYARILAVLTGSPDDAMILSAGAQLVKGRGGEVRAVLALPRVSGLMLSDGMSYGYLSQDVIEAIQQGNDQARRKTETLILATNQREGLAMTGPGGGINLLPEEPTREFDMLAETPLCDLVMASQSAFTSLGLWSRVVSGALLDARVPFYVVRRAPPERGIAAIAWDGSQAAGRAVRGALPLLTAAAKVVIVQDPDHLSASHRLASDPGNLAAYLKLHGVTEVRVVIQAGLTRGGGLGAAAWQARADVLVAGAFSHARAMEALFGGATADLLEPSGDFNLLLAH